MCVHFSSFYNRRRFHNEVIVSFDIIYFFLFKLKTWKNKFLVNLNCFKLIVKSGEDNRRLICNALHNGLETLKKKIQIMLGKGLVWSEHEYLIMRLIQPWVCRMGGSRMDWNGSADDIPHQQKAQTVAYKENDNQKYVYSRKECAAESFVTCHTRKQTIGHALLFQLKKQFENLYTQMETVWEHPLLQHVSFT